MKHKFKHTYSTHSQILDSRTLRLMFLKKDLNNICRPRKHGTSFLSSKTFLYWRVSVLGFLCHHFGFVSHLWKIKIRFPKISKQRWLQWWDSRLSSPVSSPKVIHIYMNLSIYLSIYLYLWIFISVVLSFPHSVKQVEFWWRTFKQRNRAHTWHLLVPEETLQLSCIH